MTATWFAPGPATAYVADGVIAVVADHRVDNGLISRCVSSAEWPALVEAIDERAAALVLHSDDLLRVAVVGSMTVDVDAPDGRHQIVGCDEVMTHEFADAHCVTIRSDGVVADVEPTHCVDDGVVPVSLVSRRLVAPAVATTDPFDALFGPTVARTVEEAAMRRVGADVDRDAEPVGVLVFTTGDRVVVDRTIVIGRNPRRPNESSAATGLETGARCVKVAAPGVSRRHALIRVDRWHASIDDLGSSNGTRVALPGQVPTPIRPGQPVDLVAGAVVDLGGEVSFAVEEVA